ncbi:hypothetical protein QOZ80_2AG0146990 [Eleusine coracana subsp. coracana]|nr:hypothetical protein QOZ80_2AG0146990 [Eleusine coracana subsp. coracana]
MREAEAHQSVQALATSLGSLPPEFVRPEQEQPGATTFPGAAAPDAPVIDMSAPGSGEGIAAAARECGLFQVVNHGVPPAAVAELQRVGRAFFALPQAEKQRHAMDPASGKIEGYGTKLQRDLDGKKTWNDFFFHVVAPPAMVDHGIWPASPDGYREANEEYCRHMQRLTRDLFEHLSLGLGLDKGAMATVTILVPNDVQGLQVFRDGHWYDAKYVPDALIVHIGDQIEIFSNGEYKAVLHRTTVNKEKTRMSWPVFVEPPGELVVEPHPKLVSDDSPAKYKAKKYKDYQHCKINKLPM